MFPGIDVTTLKLNNCRRVVLLNYDEASDSIDFRHYFISAVPVGLTKGVRKVIKVSSGKIRVQPPSTLRPACFIRCGPFHSLFPLHFLRTPFQGKIPGNLHSREDVADWVENPAGMSDSEAELPEDSRVSLPQDLVGRGNLRAGTSALKLKELGPRMTMQLVKIEDGVCSGTVLYHAYVKKSEEEMRSTARRKLEEAQSKADRKAVQAANVLRKHTEAEEKLRVRRELRAQRALLRQQKLEAGNGAGGDSDDSESGSDDGRGGAEDDGAGAAALMDKERFGEDDDDLRFDDDEEEEGDGGEDGEAAEFKGLGKRKREAGSDSEDESDGDSDDGSEEESDEGEEEEEEPRARPSVPSRGQAPAKHGANGGKAAASNNHGKGGNFKPMSFSQGHAAPKGGSAAGPAATSKFAIPNRGRR